MRPPGAGLQPGTLRSPGVPVCFCSRRGRSGRRASRVLGLRGPCRVLSQPEAEGTPLQGGRLSVVRRVWRESPRPPPRWALPAGRAPRWGPAVRARAPASRSGTSPLRSPAPEGPGEASPARPAPLLQVSPPVGRRTPRAPLTGPRAPAALPEAATGLAPAGPSVNPPATRRSARYGSKGRGCLYPVRSGRHSQRLDFSSGCMLPISPASHLAPSSGPRRRCM